jgi:tight adherence protein B
MNGPLFLLLVFAAVAAANAVYYFVRYLGERPGEELRRRLQIVGSTSAGVQLLRRRRLGSSPMVAEMLSGLDSVESLETLLDQTDWEISVPALLGLMVGLAVAGFLVPVLLGRPTLALVAGPGLGLLPILMALSARAARTRKINEQLPDTLDMMARAVKAGHAVPASLKLVAQECAPPIAVEFARAYEQQNLGLSLEAAVQNMTERVPGSLDLKLLAVSLNIQGETGGNLVEILENIADTMRERFKFYSKLSALTAEGRASGLVLGSLPVVVSLLIWAGNPEYISELGHGLGLWILCGGFVLWVLGILVLRQLAQVEY